MLFPLENKDTDCWWFGIAATLKYGQSFKNGHIAEDLFGSRALNFVGALAPTTTASLPTGCRIEAENFGISQQAAATLTLSPSIKRFVARFQLHFGLDEWVSGLWFKVVLPVEWARWELRPCSTLITGTTTLNTTPFPPGCMGSSLSASVTPAPDLPTALGGTFLFGDMQTPWPAGKFTFCNQTKTKLADVRFYLGWNFWNCDDYGIGAYLIGVAPAGNKPNVAEVFSPVIGNGKHGELGGGINAWAELWNCNDNHVIEGHLMGHAMHMFKKCENRLFDLLNAGCLSRYMLLKQFTQTNSTFTYKNLLPGTSFTERQANVSVNVKGEAVIELRYRNNCGWSTGLGYDVFGRSREKICKVSSSPLVVGLKGCAPVAVNAYSTVCSSPAAPSNEVITTPLTVSSTVTLLATQSNATISSCGTTDNPTIGTTRSALTCPLAGTIHGFIAVNSCSGLVPAVGTAVSTLTPVTDSTTPVLLTDANLDLRSGEAGRNLSNKVFWHGEYTWNDCDWSPYVMIGAEGEFASKKDRSTLNQWAVWLAGGFEF